MEKCGKARIASLATTPNARRAIARGCILPRFQRAAITVACRVMVLVHLCQVIFEEVPEIHKFFENSPSVPFSHPLIPA